MYSQIEKLVPIEQPRLAEYVYIHVHQPCWLTLPSDHSEVTCNSISRCNDYKDINYVHRTFFLIGELVCFCFVLCVFKQDHKGRQGSCPCGPEDTAIWLYFLLRRVYDPDLSDRWISYLASTCFSGSLPAGVPCQSPGKTLGSTSSLVLGLVKSVWRKLLIDRWKLLIIC